MCVPEEGESEEVRVREARAGAKRTEKEIDTGELDNAIKRK